MEEKIYLTSSDEDTRHLASKLTSNFTGGDVLLLYGSMGSGKTTFTQGVATILGIHRLTSPTYVILNQYTINITPQTPLNLRGGRSYSIGGDIDKQSTIKTLNHFDLYRLESEDQLKSVNFEEIISDPESLSIVEWPEKLNNLPRHYFKIIIKSTAPTKREISFQKI